MLVVLDNRDSFTFNLVQAFQGLGHEVEVLRATRSSAADVLARRPAGIVIGPGPGPPAEARAALELLALVPRFPILGVCLGFQVLAHHFGLPVGRPGELVHGRAVPVEHTGCGLFEGLPSPLACTRYNSLGVSADAELPELLARTAWTADGDLMALAHRDLPWSGVQFHPESVLSEGGTRLLENFALQTTAFAPGSAS